MIFSHFIKMIIYKAAFHYKYTIILIKIIILFFLNKNLSKLKLNSIEKFSRNL